MLRKRFFHADARDIVGKALMQPEVIPPLERDQVAEPHMADLMKDHVDHPLEFLLRLTVIPLGDHIIAIDDAPWVFHTGILKQRAQDAV